MLFHRNHLGIFDLHGNGRYEVLKKQPLSIKFTQVFCYKFGNCNTEMDIWYRKPLRTRSKKKKLQLPASFYMQYLWVTYFVIIILIGFRGIAHHEIIIDRENNDFLIKKSRNNFHAYPTLRHLWLFFYWFKLTGTVSYLCFI